MRKVFRQENDIDCDHELRAWRGERMITTLSSALNQDQYRVIVGLSRPGWLQDECRRLNVETRVIPLRGPFHVQWLKTCFDLIRSEKSPSFTRMNLVPSCMDGLLPASLACHL